MSEFEKPEDDFHDDELARSGDNLSDDDLSDEDFLIDGELQEIEKQLMADADHMHSLYPSMNSRRLEDLVSKCLIEAKEYQSHENQPRKSNATAVQKQAAGIGRTHSNVQGGSRVGKWIQFSSVVSLCVVVASIVFVWNLPTSNESNQTAESSSTDSDWVVTRPVSLEEMPREILNASQPELEAIYDMMPTENVSVEF